MELSELLNTDCRMLASPYAEVQPEDLALTPIVMSESAPFVGIGESSKFSLSPTALNFDMDSIIDTFDSGFEFVKDLKSTQPVTAVMLDCEPSVEKVFCSDCGFVVKADGHRSRCRSPSQTGPVAKQLAWIGEALWTLFVRSTLVQSGLAQGEASQYVTNEWMSQFLPLVVDVLGMGADLTSESSVKSCATYVQAAMAVSGVCRRMVAEGSGFHNNLDMMWRPSNIMSFNTIYGFEPRPSFDGYCYLEFIPKQNWRTAIACLGIYPTWRAILKYDDVLGYVDVWYRLCENCYHVSTLSMTGMTHYTGDPKALKLVGGKRMGGVKSVNLAKELLLDYPHADWLNTKEYDGFQLLHRTVFRIRDKGYDVYTTVRNWSQLKCIFFPKEDLHGDLSGGVARASSAALALLHVAEAGSGPGSMRYISTSGVLCAHAVEG